MEAKPVWQSKTIWFNVLAGLFIALQMFGVIDEVPVMPGVELDTSAQALIVAICNLVLRKTTTQPLTIK